MPRFVLLYHECPPHFPRPSHWDFMLESGDMLRTWALGKLPRGWERAHAATARVYADCPPLAETDEVDADELADHRLDYLEFEGELSKERGRVIRVAAGDCASIGESPTCWRLSLAGAGLSDRCQIGRSNAKATRWSLSCAAS